MEKKNIIKTIISLYKEGKTKEEIILLGFNKGTVNIQIKKYLKKLNESNSPS